MTPHAITDNGHSPPYFVGMKVEVGIPLSNNNMFRDWAIINEIDEDLISLQLSRDMLPEGVSLRVGQILTIRGEYDFQIYNCRAFIVSKGYEQELLLRLTGEIVADELREFYRIDAFLPIKFHRLDDQDPENARKLWSERRKRRQEEERAREQQRLEARRERARTEEFARKQRLLSGESPVEAVSAPQDNRQEEPEDNEYYQRWSSITSVAVNISGGGLRISTSQSFPADELLLLEIFVPPVRRIVDVVARVIFSRLGNGEVSGTNYFISGLQFVYIEESARSAINKHLSGVQLKRIRQFKGFADVEPLSIDTKPAVDRHYAYLDTVEAGQPEKNTSQAGWRKKRKQVALGVLCAGIIWLFYLYFSGYVAGHPKNAIHEMFETGIRKLRGEM